MNKRYKKQKALTTAVMLALAWGMTGMVYAADVDLSQAVRTENSKTIQAAHGTYFTEEKAANQNIHISMTNNGGGAIGLEVIDGQLAAGNENTESVKINAKGTSAPYGDAYGSWVMGSSAVNIINGTNIVVTAESNGNATGLFAGEANLEGGKIQAGSSNTQTVTIHALNIGKDDDEGLSGDEVSAEGIRAVNKGEVAVNGKNLTITAEGKGAENYAKGIAANLASYYEDSGGQSKVTATGQSVIIRAAAEDGGATGIEANGAGQVTVTGSQDLTVTASSKDDNEYDAFGIQVEGADSSVAVRSPKLTISADAGYWTYGVGVDDQGQFTAAGQDVSIAAASGKYSAYGIAAVYDSQVNLNAENLSITASGTDYETAGISAKEGSQVTVDGQNLTITAKAKAGNAYGIEAYNENSHVILNTQNTTIEAASGSEWDIDYAAGIEAYDGGKVTVHHNLRLNPNAEPYTTTALDAYDNGQIIINPENTGTVTIRGNILFDQAEDTAVTVSLIGKDSSWTGNALSYDLYGGEPENISRLDLSVMNGASWTADGSQKPAEGEYADAAVNTVYNLNVANNGKVQVGGTLTIGSASEGGAALIDGTSTLIADDLIVNDQAKLTVADGANFIVNGRLSSAPTATVTLSNLAAGPQNTELLGATRYYLGNNDWNNPKTLNAADLTVDPSGMEITRAETEGFRGGSTTRRKVITNTSLQDGSTVLDMSHNTPKQFYFGTTLQGTGTAELEGKDVYYKVNVSRDAQPQTHSAVMAQTAGLTTVTNGFDFIRQAADSMKDQGVNAFVSLGGGENKYDTGSHIKTNDWHAIAGVGVKNTRDNGSNTVYGIFYDYGDGRYRTFQRAGYGSGKAIYKGGGLFGKYTAPSQFYVEGSFRAGRVKNTANGIFSDYIGNRYNLKTNSNYNAFHVGVGRIYALDNNDSLDVYGKFFHTHVNGDSFAAGGQYHLEGMDSNILRMGIRWNHSQGAWNHYWGVAYEYEFDGEAKGTADGARIKSADIGGSSARFELGSSVTSGSWILGLNANAYAGQHKGFGGSITADYKF